MEEDMSSLAGKVLKVATVEVRKFNRLFLMHLNFVVFKNLPLSGTISVDGKLIGDGMVFRILKLIEETLNFTHVVVASTNALDSVEHGVIQLK
jgi:hypothetical protein